MFKVEVRIGYEKAYFVFKNMIEAGNFISEILEHKTSESDEVEIRIMMEAE